MIIEFESALLEILHKETSWNDVCAELNSQPMPLIAVALKQLVDTGKVVCTKKENNVFYEVIHAG